MDYPNKIYTLEWTGSSSLMGKSHFVILVAASSSKIAKTYVKEKIGFDVEPIWIMSAVYPTLYISDGTVPLKIQVKILYNGSFHSNFKY